MSLLFFFNIIYSTSARGTSYKTGIKAYDIPAVLHSCPTVGFDTQLISFPKDTSKKWGILRKYIVFLKLVTCTKLRTSYKCMAETPGGTIMGYQTTGVTKKGKMLYDPGSRKPVERKEAEWEECFLPQKWNSCDKQLEHKLVFIQRDVREIQSFFREMSTKAYKPRIDPAMKGELSVLFEWLQNWFQEAEGNIFSKLSCFPPVLSSEDMKKSSYISYYALVFYFYFF